MQCGEEGERNGNYTYGTPHKYYGATIHILQKPDSLSAINTEN